MKTIEQYETSVNADGQWDVCLAGGGDMVADLAGLGAPEDQEQRATLFAAAPDLLAALQDLEGALTHSGPCQCCQGSNDDGHDERCSIIKARAAIAKAAH